MSAISTAIGNDTSAESHELPRTRLSLYYLVGYTRGADVRCADDDEFVTHQPCLR
jgi:hypothetical protein